MKFLRKHWPWLAVAAWYGLIFLFSAQTGEASGEVSDRLAFDLLRWDVDNPWVLSEVQYAFFQLVTYLLRKAAHMGVFFVLTALLLRALRDPPPPARRCCGGTVRSSGRPGRAPPVFRPRPQLSAPGRDHRPAGRSALRRMLSPASLHPPPQTAQKSSIETQNGRSWQERPFFPYILLLGLFLAGLPHPGGVVQQPLAQSQRLGRDLQ